MADFHLSCAPQAIVPVKIRLMTSMLANFFACGTPVAVCNGCWGRLAPPDRRPTDRLGRESRSQGVGRRVTGSNSLGGRSPERRAHMFKF